MGRKEKMKITSCLVITAGVTADRKYSLAINEANGEDCLCVHKCTERGGLHLSTMDEKSLVTCIGLRELIFATNRLQQMEAARQCRERED
jgi:hypothetical protein